MDVTLHVYDLSGGMARMMSAAILGDLLSFVSLVVFPFAVFV